MPRLTVDAPLIYPGCEIANSSFGAWCEVKRGSRVLNSDFGDSGCCDRSAGIAKLHGGGASQKSRPPEVEDVGQKREVAVKEFGLGDRLCLEPYPSERQLIGVLGTPVARMSKVPTGILARMGKRHKTEMVFRLPEYARGLPINPRPQV